MGSRVHDAALNDSAPQLNDRQPNQNQMQEQTVIRQNESKLTTNDG